MGCDIHLVVQQMIRDEDPQFWGYWHEERRLWWLEDFPDTNHHAKRAYAALHALTRRNYEWFGALAGVRGNGGPCGSIAPDRGLPEDFPLDTFEEYRGIWMGDHSYSWCSLKELLEWEGWQHKPYFATVEFLAAVEWLKERADGEPEMLRLVFGFDS